MGSGEEPREELCEHSLGRHLQFVEIDRSAAPELCLFELQLEALEARMVLRAELQGEIRVYLRLREVRGLLLRRIGGGGEFLQPYDL